MFGSRLRTLAIAVIVAAVVLVVTGKIGGKAYAGYPAYRAQVDAFLDGRLALSEAPDALGHDLAWTDSGVQQVWGLGVPALQTPFEVIGRVIGVTPFPDRVPMLVWLALMIFVAVRAFRREGEPWWIGAGTIAITAALPAFVTLVRSRSGVYEEAAFYAYAAAIMLLGGLARFIHRPTSRGYVLLVAVAGLTGFLRPTVWFYGLSTFAIATVVWLLHIRAQHAEARGSNAPTRAWIPRAMRVAAFGTALFVAGGGLLYASNARRFGAGTEFGHRLNIEALPGNVVATRFSHPFERVRLDDAAAELLTSLFTRPELQSQGKSFYQTGLHIGQQGTPRWREYYFTTFSWPYVPLLIAGLILAVLAWRRTSRDREARWLGPWALIALVPLLLFYLRSPSLSSRYQLDLAPAFAALLVIVWRAAALRFRAVIVGSILAIAWTIAVLTSKVANPRISANPDPVDRDTAALATYELSRPTIHDHVLPAAYDLDDPELAVNTDVVPTFDRCTDEIGQPLGCDIQPWTGDQHIHGERDAVGWVVTRERVEEPVSCRAEELRCEASETIAASSDAVVESIEMPGPALYLNASGWDLATGRVPVATHFFVSDPQFIEVEADFAPASDRLRTIADWSVEVRVVVGLARLHLTSTASTATGVRLHFESDRPLGEGVRVAFVAFGPDHDLARDESDFVLRRIRWR